jgi:hypothetical protein
VFSIRGQVWGQIHPHRDLNGAKSIPIGSGEGGDGGAVPIPAPRGDPFSTSHLCASDHPSAVWSRSFKRSAHLKAHICSRVYIPPNDESINQCGARTRRSGRWARPVTPDRTCPTVKNPLRVVSGVDLTLWWCSVRCQSGMSSQRLSGVGTYASGHGAGASGPARLRPVST